MSGTGFTMRGVVASTLAVTAITLLLNILLSAYVWVPRGAFMYAFVPLVESLGLLWILLAGRRLTASRRLRRIGTGALGGALGILGVFAVAEAFFRYYYARSFMPNGDIGMVRGALLLFFGDIGRTADILTPITIIVIVLAAGALGAGALFGIARATHALSNPLTGLAVVTLIAAAVTVTTGLPDSLTKMSVASWFGEGELELVQIDEFSSTAAGGMAEPRGAETGFSPPDATASTVSPRDSSRFDTSSSDAPASETSNSSAAEGGASFTFPGLLDRDIYMFAVEAYGYAAFHRPELASRIRPYRESLADALQGKGYAVRTAFFESPVAGGYSWLAEASLLTGQWIDSQENFKKLYNANLPSFSGMLQRGGYYTLTLRPGTVHGSWPEGWDLYRFEEALIAHDGDFNYEGPWFSYVPITDQYALWTGEQRVRELVAPGGVAAENPLLAYYQLVSSHTPYNKIPPVIQDWSALGNGEIYHQRSDEIRTFDNSWTGGSELQEGYVAAIGYVLTVLRDYVANIMQDDRDPIIVIFGDHQPQRPIRSPQAALSVPIHVASRDPEVLAGFEEHGFERGMESTAPPPHPKMSSFSPMMAEIAQTPRGVAEGTKATGPEIDGTDSTRTEIVEYGNEN